MEVTRMAVKTFRLAPKKLKESRYIAGYTQLSTVQQYCIHHCRSLRIHLGSPESSRTEWPHVMHPGRKALASAFNFAPSEPWKVCFFQVGSKKRSSRCWNHVKTEALCDLKIDENCRFYLPLFLPTAQFGTKDQLVGKIKRTPGPTAKHLRP